MWYVCTKNGGLYSDVCNEFVAREELQVMFTKAYEAKKNGLKARISLWEGDYSHGHYSSVGLINDETLDEMYVSYDYGYCYGDRKWSVEIYDPKSYETIEKLHFEY